MGALRGSPPADAPAEGRAYLFLTAGCRADAGPDRTFAAPAGDDDHGSFGYAVAGATDVDGDGHPDVVVTAPRATTSTGGGGRAYVFRGADALAPPIALVPRTNGPTLLAGAVAGGGDFDGDGDDDLALAASTPTAEAGLVGDVLFYAGGASGPASYPTATASDGYAGGRFGRDAVAYPGDVDGDGRSDLVVGAPTSPTRLGGSRFGAGRAYLLFGASPIPQFLDASQTLSGDDLSVRGFGASVE